MSTLGTGDLHFSANPRDEYRWVFLEETLPKLIRRRRVRRLFVFGDLTEIKDGHPATLVNRLTDGIASIAEEVNIYIIRGNHDYRAEDIPFFRYLQHIPRVRWINKPTGLNLRGLGRCLFIPHQPSPDFWAKKVKPGYDWYFCHETFEGASSETGHKLAGISQAVFPRGARVVSGDIHKPQTLKKVTYVGAPYTVDFGDEYEPRVLLLDGDKKTSIPVPGVQKRLITGSVKNSLLVLSGTDQLQKGDIVKVRVELPAGAETPRAEVRAQTRKWAEDFGVELSVTEVNAPRATTQGANRRRRSSDSDLVRAYAKKMGKGKVTITAGLKIVKETT